MSPSPTTSVVCPTLLGLALCWFAACAADGTEMPADKLQPGAPFKTEIICRHDSDCRARIHGDWQCRTVSCNLEAARCEITPRPDATPCDDQDPCSTGSKCVAGVCQPGTPFAFHIEEGTHCLEVYCDPETGVSRTRPSAVTCAMKFGPGEPCWTWRCSDECDDEGECRYGVCRQAARADGTPCDDLDPCTVDTHCRTGRCVGERVCDYCHSDLDCIGHESACQGGFRCHINQCVPLHDGVDCTLDPPRDCRHGVCLEPDGECATILADEGSPCGEKDRGRCSANGVCLQDGCGCLGDSDCAILDPDDDLCTGFHVCDLGPDGRRCCRFTNPYGAACPPAEAEARCEAYECLPATGECRRTGLLPEGTPCDDLDPCTEDTTCDANGICRGGNNLCPECRIDLDCAGLDDLTDLCGGRHICSHLEWPPRCIVDPDSIVTCDTSLDGPCRTTACQPATGRCSTTYTPNGFPCDDSDPCTLALSCLDGQCVAGEEAQQRDCDDLDPCTINFCLAGRGCHSYPADGAACRPDDSSGCRIGVCRDGLCLDAGPKDCNDSNPCTRGVCDEMSGECVQEPLVGAECCDSDPCTSGAWCDEDGACVGGAPMICDDGNDCTAGRCVADLESTAPLCVYEPLDDLLCDDTRRCIRGGICVEGECTWPAGDPCDDGHPCTENLCDPATGCSNPMRYDCCGNDVLEDSEDCDGTPGCSVDCVWHERDLTHEQIIAAPGQVVSLGPGRVVALFAAEGALQGRIIDTPEPSAPPEIITTPGDPVTGAVLAAEGSPRAFAMAYVERSSDGAESLVVHIVDSALQSRYSWVLDPGDEPPHSHQIDAATLWLERDGQALRPHVVIAATELDAGGRPTGERGLVAARFGVTELRLPDGSSIFVEESDSPRVRRLDVEVGQVLRASAVGWDDGHFAVGLHEVNGASFDLRLLFMRVPPLIAPTSWVTHDEAIPGGDRSYFDLSLMRDEDELLVAFVRRANTYDANLYVGVRRYVRSDPEFGVYFDEPEIVVRESPEPIAELVVAERRGPEDARGALLAWALPATQRIQYALLDQDLVRAAAPADLLTLPAALAPLPRAAAAHDENGRTFVAWSMGNRFWGRVVSP